MCGAVRKRVVVGPGGTIEVQSSDLPEGAAADVIVILNAAPTPQRTLSSFIGAAPGGFSSVAEVDAYLNGERDAWER